MIGRSGGRVGDGMFGVAPRPGRDTGQREKVGREGTTMGGILEITFGRGKGGEGMRYIPIRLE